MEALLVLNLKGLTDEQIRNLPEAQAILLIREIYLAEDTLKELSLILSAVLIWIIPF